MDINEIKEKQNTLKRDLERLISQFICETGCVPNIDVDYTVLNQFGTVGQTSIPVVSLNSVIR